MVGRRGKNLREGDLAEGIGLELLRAFTAVAPVPRTEDIGIDAICTLLRPHDQLLFAEDSFLVQLKSASVRAVEFHEEEYEWLLRLSQPIYLASVNLRTAAIDLHTMQRAVDRVDDSWRGVTAYLDTKSCDDGDDYDHALDVRDGIHHIYLGSPILSWSAVESATDEFRQKAYEVMKGWIEWEETNLKLRAYKCCYVPRWQTNEGPNLSHSRFGTTPEPSFVKDFGIRFGAAILALARDCTTSEVTTLLDVIDILRRKGIKAIELQAAELELRRMAKLGEE